SDRNHTRRLSGRNDTPEDPKPPPASRIHASSCSVSTTRVLPDSGSSATYQRSLLSADRAPATANLPSSDSSGIDQRISRSARWPGFGVWLASGSDDGALGGVAAFSLSSIGGAKLPSAHTDLPVLRFSTASSRRSCVSPTAVRPGMSSV